MLANSHPNQPQPQNLYVQHSLEHALLFDAQMNGPLSQLGGDIRLDGKKVHYHDMTNDLMEQSNRYPLPNGPKQAPVAPKAPVKNAAPKAMPKPQAHKAVAAPKAQAKKPVAKPAGRHVEEDFFLSGGYPYNPAAFNGYYSGYQAPVENGLFIDDGKDDRQMPAYREAIAVDGKYLNHQNGYNSFMNTGYDGYGYGAWGSAAAEPMLNIPDFLM